MAQGNPLQPLFVEQQRFTQWWLWVVVGGIAALEWWGFVQQIILRRPFGDNPAPDSVMLVITMLFGIGLPWLMLSCRLVTVVRPDALYVRFVPFHLRPRAISYAEIKGCQAVRYSPLLDYGGWGIRMGRGGMAYNVSGNLGVRLQLASGRHLLIGSRDPSALAAAIDKARQPQAPVA